MTGNATPEGVPRMREMMLEKTAALIRNKSAAGALLAESDILHLIDEEIRRFPEAKQADESPVDWLCRSIRETEDLQQLEAAGTGWYYSLLHMTKPYAELLIRKLDGPLCLIAETVRQNARDFQRPVPIELFEDPPFNLDRDQVLQNLAVMAATNVYADITTTCTSQNGIYLYSKTCLEAGYAVMLAEWFHVGQSENP